MGRAQLADASDGHLARVAPSWTEEKLRIVRCYIEGFAKACKRAGGWYAIDAFAGGGLNISATTRNEIKGSALILLEAGPPRATRVLLCEQGTKVIAALRDRTASYGERAVILPGDANLRISELLARVPRTAPAFAFLDPEGADVAWSTVAEIARHKQSARRRVEQLILFPTDMGFVRMLSLRTPLEARLADRVTRMYGHEGWRAIWERRCAEELSADEARGAYVRLYANGFRRLGYRHVLDRQITREDGRPMYFLLFATDDNTGRQIMDHCFDKRHFRSDEELGQMSLLGETRAPRRRRLS